MKRLQGALWATAAAIVCMANCAASSVASTAPAAKPAGESKYKGATVGDDERVARGWQQLLRMQPDAAIAAFTGPFIDAMQAADYTRASRYMQLIGFGFRLDENELSALACYQMANKLNPSDLVAQSLVAETLLRLHRYDEATPYFKALEPLAANNRVAARAMGFYYHYQPRLAQKYLERALELDPTDNRARTTLARVVENPEEAAKLYRLVADSTPSPYLRELFLFNADDRAGSKASAEHLLKAGEILPRDPLWHAKLAMNKLGKGDESGFADGMRQGTQCPRFLERAYTQYAAYLMFHGRGDDAEKCLRHLLKVKPYSAEAHWSLGNLYNLRNDEKKAEAEYHEALRLDRQQKQAYSSLSQLPSIRFNKARAYELADAWVQNCPRSPEAWIFKGSLLRQDGKWQEALAAYNVADQHQTRKNWEKNNGRRLQICAIEAAQAACYYKLNDLQAAQDKARAFNEHKPVQSGTIQVRPGRVDFSKLKPGTPAYLATGHGLLADVLFETGLLNDCVNEYKEAIAADNANPEWHRGLLKVYIDKQDWSGAVKEDMVVANDIVTRQLPASIKDLQRTFFNKKD